MDFTRLNILMFFSVFSVHVIGQGFHQKKLTLVLNQLLAPCIKNKKFAIYHKNVALRQINNSLILDYDTVVTETIPVNILLVIDVQRCKGADSPDTCTKFLSIRSSKVCSMADADNQVWTPLIKCNKPPIKCAGPKVTHVGRNCTLDMSHYNWFPLPNAYWKMNVTFRLEDRLLYCVIAEGTAKYV